jgi:hypothetical protein
MKDLNLVKCGSNDRWVQSNEARVGAISYRANGSPLSQQVVVQIYVAHLNSHLRLEA